MTDKVLSRRRLLELGAAIPLATVLAYPRGTRASGTACGAPLVEQTAGPYYLPGAPRRRSLLGQGVVGTRLVISGRVLNRRCKPVAGATLDVWQADGNGEYDVDGFRLRGVQQTDRAGRYRLVTVVPGQYPGRTEHIHVKIRPRGGRERTTQLYFPGSAANTQDGIFDPRMLLRNVRRAASGWTATFDFVL